MFNNGDQKGQAKVIIAAVVVVLVIVGAYFVVSGGLGGGEKENVKMGLMMPQTGDLSFIAPPMIHGGKLAAKEINEAGGILENRKINLIVGDTGTSPTESRDVASKLIDVNDVEVIVGPASSGDAKAILNQTVNNQVVQIGPSNTSAYFTTSEDKGYYFRTCPSDILQAAAMASLAVSENYETASSIVVNNAYGTGFARVFAREFKEKGGEILARKAFNKDTTTFSSIVSEAAKNNPDVIVLCCYHKNGGQILKEAYQQGIMDDTDFLLSEGLEDENLADAAGADYIVENVKGTTPKPSYGVGYQSYKQSYKEEYGQEPGIYSPHTYDAVAIAALAIQKAGVYKGSEIKNYIIPVANPPGQKVTDLSTAIDLLKQGKEINYQGASSQITFDDVGDITTGSYRTWWFEDGKIKYGEEIEFSV